MPSMTKTPSSPTRSPPARKRAAPKAADRLVFTPEAPPQPSVAPSASLSAGRQKVALAALVLGSSLAFIDGSVVSVALPAIQGDLGANAAQVQWIVNGYLLALGALVLIGGAAGDRWGRKRVFLVGVAFFTLASLLCAAVWTPENLIAGRVLQGVGAAMLVPTALALIPVCFAEEQRGRALGIWAGASAVAAAIGPVVGGWITDEFTWRGVFLINGPVALAAMALAAWAIPESREHQADPPDWPGAVLAVAFLGLLGWGLSAGIEWGLASLKFWGVMAAAFAVLILFLRVEVRSPYPMMPMQLFGSRAFTAVNLLTVCLYFALAGVLYLLPFEWMRVDGHSAAKVGAGLLPFSMVLGLASPFAGRAADRFGVRPFLIAGPAVAGVGLAMMILPREGADYWTAWFPALLVLALGMAVTIAPLTTALFASVRNDRAGIASGVNNAAARVGGMVAVAVLTLVVSIAFAAQLGGQPEIAAERLSVVMGGGDYSDAVTAGERDAFRRAFQVAIGVCAGFAFIASLSAALFMPRSAPDRALA